jgi:hypothetical protein
MTRYRTSRDRRRRGDRGPAAPSPAQGLADLVARVDRMASAIDRLVTAVEELRLAVVDRDGGAISSSAPRVRASATTQPIPIGELRELLGESQDARSSPTAMRDDEVRARMEEIARLLPPLPALVVRGMALLPDVGPLREALSQSSSTPAQMAEVFKTPAAAEQLLKPIIAEGEDLARWIARWTSPEPLREGEFPLRRTTEDRTS